MRKSKIYLMSDEEFISLVERHVTMADAMRELHLINKGNNYKTFMRRVKALNIDYSHFLSRIQSSCFKNEYTKEEFMSSGLIVNSPMSRHRIKTLLIKFNLLPYQCTKCAHLGNWMNDTLVLQLEHINGMGDDNRLENLCFLCPNCHSQTSTFAGRKLKKIKEMIKIKKDRKTKIIWPDIHEFQELLWKLPTSTIACNLGVSDVAIGKFCKKHSLSKPARGFWVGRDTRI